jgi:hypothetical protein
MMASQSEIILAKSTGDSRPPKKSKSRTRRKAPSKSVKKTASRTSSKAANENKTAKSTSKSAVVPITKLRAIDIAGNAKPKSPDLNQPDLNQNGMRRKDEAGKNEVQKDREQQDALPIIKMPSAGLLSGIAKNETADMDLISINGIGSELSESADVAETVTDPELLELLEQLSVTIDTANTVLDAAASAPDEGMPSLIQEPVFEPEPEPKPEPDPEPDDTPPLAAQFASLSPAPPMELKRNLGFSKTITASISALAVIAGIGWLLYTNPWLMEAGIKVASTTDTSAGASLNKEPAPTLAAPILAAPIHAAPIHANVAPEAVLATAAPDIVQTSPRLKSQPLAAARVRIGQSVAGKVGRPIALTIDLPASTTDAEMSIMIQGMPEKARLSAGKSLGSGNWLLGEAELQNLMLYTAASFEPAKFNLDVILVKSDGKVPEVHKLSVIIEPAITAARTPDSGAAPPSSATTYDQTGVAVALPIVPEQRSDPAPAMAPVQVAAKPAPKPAAPIAQETPVKKSPAVPVITRQEIKTLMTRANALLENGDVAGARLLLEYAAQRGSKQAMIMMGNTFDPEHLASLGVHGVKPDQEQAAFWNDLAAKAVEAQ